MKHQPKKPTNYYILGTNNEITRHPFFCSLPKIIHSRSSDRTPTPLSHHRACFAQKILLTSKNKKSARVPIIFVASPNFLGSGPGRGGVWYSGKIFEFPRMCISVNPHNNCTYAFPRRCIISPTSLPMSSHVCDFLHCIQ